MRSVVSFKSSLRQYSSIAMSLEDCALEIPESVMNCRKAAGV